MSYRDSFNFEPLRIMAHFQTNPVCDRWFPIDGVILSQANRQALGPELAAMPGGAPIQGAPTLPLEIVHQGRRNWYYACSWAQPQPWWIEEDMGYWNKRFDTEFDGLIDFGRRRGKVIIAQGRNKAYHMPIFKRVVRQVEWYCIGDKKCLIELLSTCTGLGKKRAYGEGAVTRWEIESIPEDWSIMRDGRLMRGIPVDDAQVLDVPFKRAHYGIRPSYWKSSNQMWLAVPDGG